jgi:hypothetical protein
MSWGESREGNAKGVAWAGPEVIKLWIDCSPCVAVDVAAERRVYNQTGQGAKTQIGDLRLTALTLAPRCDADKESENARFL